MLKIIIVSIFFVFLSAMNIFAASCDQYPGDSWIYGGITSSVKPNVLIILDTSGSMDNSPTGNNSNNSNSAGCYDSSGNSTTCLDNRIYRLKDNQWRDAGFNLADVTTSCDGKNPQNLLTTTGQYLNSRRLTDSGGCRSDGTGSYSTGSYIKSLNSTGSCSGTRKIDIAICVLQNLVQNTTGVNFGVMIFNSGTKSGDGSTFFSNSSITKSTGASYISTISDMEAQFNSTKKNRDALVASINLNTINFDKQTSTPLAESLYEAGLYFKGLTSSFSNTVGLSGTPLKYTSPITSSCQKNYVILITDGASTADNDSVLGTICNNGDCDGDNAEPATGGGATYKHSLDDVAKYLYDSKFSVTYNGNLIENQNISTYTVSFDLTGDSTATQLLKRTSDNTHGHGASYDSSSQAELSTALVQVVSSIIDVDSSYVAPVVPVSPENRTYNSSRVYMGFFKPINQLYWNGNLKKYGIDANNNIIDKNGNPAMWIDADGNGIDDNTNAALPAGASHGSFRSTSTSFWSSTADAGDVNSGGVGDLLLSRDVTNATTGRKLYTHTGTNSSLTHASNAFNKTNTAITSNLLGVADSTAKDKLVDFVYGIDSYDENANGNTTEKRGWLMGDILHSKPLVVNYASYTMNSSNEANCSVNKSYIFVGSNDGMLHAFKDCDGSEAWGFIPPDVLPNLKEIPGTIHTYTVDSSASVYKYDANNNGTIDSGDKVIMLVGLRRGGGGNSGTAKGSYYALDISDPAAPVYLWSVSNATSGFSELAESWSEPKIAKIKVGTTAKIVALIPGGYDNISEDGRFGATQNLATAVSNSTSGAGSISSSSNTATSSTKGRAVYVFEIATLSSTGVPTVATTANRIWGVTYGASTDYANYTSTQVATDSGMNYSFAADVATIDVDGDGYADRMYAADLGGNLWRFDIGSSAVANWRGYKIFSSNPATGTDTGRKIFYKPAVTIEASVTASNRGNDAYIMLGTGDREHPTNTAVIDRMYLVKDKGQTSAKTESDMENLTTDQLQVSTTANTGGTGTPTTGSVDYYLKRLASSSNYGWYVKLDQNSGEKVTASPTLFNKTVYFTTFTPGASTSADPCKPSNLGTSRIYAMNYLTAEAVINYDKTNDSTTTTNKRANAGTATNPVVLLRSDREKTLGSGIPSGVVLVVNPGGGLKALIGSSGSILSEDVKKGGSIMPLYWGKK